MLLFHIYADKIIREDFDNCERRIGIVRRVITKLRYADDTTNRRNNGRPHRNHGKSRPDETRWLGR